MTGEEAGLGAAFFDRPVLEVASELLGATITHAGVTVRLTEVEAYAGPGDPGSHAFRGRTARVEVMFGPPGGLYVYFTYGMHYCMNLVCGPEGSAGAVLLRAGQVTRGAELARGRRGARVPDRDLARGPARLTQALAVGPEQAGLLTTRPGSPVVVRPAPLRPEAGGVQTGPRVGVGGPGGDATAYPWRFFLAGEPTVSAYRPAQPRARRHTNEGDRPA